MTNSTLLKTDIYERIAIYNKKGQVRGFIIRTEPRNKEQIEIRVEQVWGKKST